MYAVKQCRAGKSFALMVEQLTQFRLPVHFSMAAEVACLPEVALETWAHGCRRKTLTQNDNNNGGTAVLENWRKKC